MTLTLTYVQWFGLAVALLLVGMFLGVLLMLGEGSE